jgi:hypothetical protein
MIKKFYQKPEATIVELRQSELLTDSTAPDSGGDEGSGPTAPPTTEPKTLF